MNDEKKIVNDLRYTTLNNPYDLVSDYKKALSGEILPDDNVRVYVPMDINADSILGELSFIHSMLGPATERNEYSYQFFVSKVLSKLSIYCEYQGIDKTRELVKEIISCLWSMEGLCEEFPYTEIRELEEKYGGNYD